MSDHAQQAAGDGATKLIAIVKKLLQELHPDRGDYPIEIKNSLDRDLGIDSLGRVELVLRIEREFSIQLPEQTFATSETVEDLIHAIQVAAPELAVSTKKTVAAYADQGGTPEHAGTLSEVLQWHVSRHADRPHIRFLQSGQPDQVITYGDLYNNAVRTAGGLQMRGVQAGDRVAIMLPSGESYFNTFFGIILAGAIPVPIYPPVRRHQLADHLTRQSRILENCQPRVLITVVEAKALAHLLQAQVTELSHVVTAEELLQDSARYQAPLIDGDSIAFLQYTSGSTGTPKGVVLTHQNLLANIRADGNHIQADQHDVFVSWLPLYHDMGLIGAWLGSLYFSVPLVCMSPLSFLSRPRSWLWAIHRYGGTLSAAPNFAYELCLTKIRDKDIEGLDLSTWRVAFNGAEAISAQTIQKFTERFSPYGFHPETMYPVYGLAECAVGLAFPPLGTKPVVDYVDRERLMTDKLALPVEAGDSNATSYVFCGRPLAGHEIRIVDSSGRELPDRHVGNLQFRGPSATSGYYKQADKTQELFSNGWLNSGDRAYEVNGDIYITGREKDMIIRAGRNIYPEELEEKIGEVQNVRRGRVAVFGSDDPESGTERLIIVAETRTQDAEKQAMLSRQISEHTVDLLGTPPDQVVLAPAGTVLKTSSGKLRRGDCKQLFEQGAIGKPRKALWLQLTKLGLHGIRPQVKRLVRGISTYLYAGWCWFCLGILGVTSLVAVQLLPNPHSRWKFVHRAARLFARMTFTPFDVQGVENIPRDKPSVIVANHGSYLDGIILVGAIPYPFSFVAKAELENVSIVGRFLKRIEVLFVDRGHVQNAAEDAKRLAENSRDRHSIMFFPEGTFYRSPGILPFRMGAFVTAMENQVPVIPVAIRGTRNILHANSWLPKKGRISVHIGTPINPEVVQTPNDERWSGAVRLRQQAREFITLNCDEPDLATAGLAVPPQT